jgi:hypothetical protein
MADHPREIPGAEMNLSRKNKKRLATYAVYSVLCGGIIWQLSQYVPPMFGAADPNDEEPICVNVSGNVLRPGQYKVPPGTTHFEILKVAGVRPTSDLSMFNLTQQITDNQQLQVGTMPNPVTMKKGADKIRCEFSLGDVTVIASDGRTKPQEEGMEIAQGDRVLTEEKSQAELSVSTFSRIDMDNFSELVFDKIGVVENTRATTLLLQKSGTCWYKIVYGSKNELFRITTPFVNVTVAGTGADFTITTKSDEINVSNMDGLLLIERTGSTEAINLISGQSATIYNDSRPFQVTSIGAETNPAERYSLLTKEKASVMMRHMPLNFVFCGVPGVYFFGSVQFEKGVVHMVNLPAETSVEEYVQGCTTLEQAFLYGGAIFVTTLIEQIVDTRIPKYCVLEKEDIVRITGTLGGLKIPLDDKAASLMKLSKGLQKLSSHQLAVLLKPGLSGTEDFKQRLFYVIKALFEALSSKNIVMTTLLAEQIFTNLQTNFTPNEVMDEYGKFSAVSSWAFKQHPLPVKQNIRGGHVVWDPILEDCRKILQN